MEKYVETTKEMMKFIDNSPSCFHAIENVKLMLNQEGFQELMEGEEWTLTGGDYYVTRNDSSIIAFRLSDNSAYKGFHIVASHSDFPTFKIKENPEMVVEDKYIKINTEKYGGMIISTWLDRPLSVAGRIAVCKDNQIITKLVNINQDLFVIPNLSIHMNREMNKGVEYNPQVDMLPLFADGTVSQGKGSLLTLLAQEAEVEPEQILGHDLFLYPRSNGCIFGENGEFVLSPRLDDLQCVYASAKAFIESKPQNFINMCVVFDNEEVGSGTRQGADSTFLEDVMLRLNETMGQTPSKLRQLIANSLLISADNAHAVHPNHPDKTDPTNRCYLNGGIVIKYHGSQKYTTDAVSGGYIKHLCNQADVPFQTYANKSDMVGGSTLGNISTAHISVASVDIGFPQLAMHSVMETAGVRDTLYGVRLLEQFYRE